MDTCSQGRELCPPLENTIVELYDLFSVLKLYPFTVNPTLADNNNSSGVSCGNPQLILSWEACRGGSGFSR